MGEVVKTTPTIGTARSTLLRFAFDLIQSTLDLGHAILALPLCGGGGVDSRSRMVLTSARHSAPLCSRWRRR